MGDTPSGANRTADGAVSIRQVLLAVSDSINIDPPRLGVYVGGTGSLRIEDQGGNDITFSNVQAGTILPISPVRIRIGTSASLLVGLY